MLRFSLSGAFVVFELVQSSASIVNTESITAAGCTLVLATLSALPEITRRANAFINGEGPDALA